MRIKRWFIVLMAFVGLGLAGLSTQNVKADSVVIPYRDSAFLTYPKEVLNVHNAIDFKVDEESFVPSLSVWRTSNVVKVADWSPEPWANIIYPSTQAFEVGPNLWLTNTQAFVLPFNEIVNQPINQPPHGYGNIFDDHIHATVENDGPITLWATPSYETPVQWIQSGTDWEIKGYYYSDQTGLWFDLGSGQWLSAYYVIGKISRF